MSAAQVKAFRLMVNRSVTWASWDDELFALELQELNEAEFDLSLTGFDPKEIDDLLLDPGDDDQANAAPPLPENPVLPPGDLWLCGPHRLHGASGERKLATDNRAYLADFHPADGLALARTDRQSDGRRWHPRPAGSQRPPHRDARRFDA
jgi:hypothetical protein